MLSLAHVHKTYRGPRDRVVLQDVNLELAPGDYIAVTGESGSGKSTLLNLIAGLDVPDSGSLRLDGTELTTLDDDARTLLRRHGMGFVFQAFLLLPHLTVIDNAALPLRLNAMPRDEALRMAGDMLDAVGLGAARDRLPRTLSGGETQRVAIARALVHRPRLLLADEPTGNLDADSAHAVLALLRAQVKAGGGMGILVTHSAAAAATADRVYCLEDGALRRG